jgi:hypothetical protein
LDIFHGSAELPLDFPRAKQGGDAGTGKVFGAFDFLQQDVFHLARAVSEHPQWDRFECHRLPALRIVGLVDDTGRGLRQFTEDFEVTDFRRHCRFQLRSAFPSDRVQ